jgi:hypothetical protein
MARPVKRVQPMNNHTPKAHLLARLGSGMEGVIVSIQPIKQRSLGARRLLKHHIWLLALWRRIVDCRWPLWSAPSTLPDVERRADNSRVDLARGDHNPVCLGLHDRAGAALVPDADNLGAGFELLAFGGGREGLEELDESLAVNSAGSVESGDAWDPDGFLRGVKVDYFLGVRLEGEDYGVCWEDGEVGMKFLERLRQYWMGLVAGLVGTYVEKVKLFLGGADRPRKEEDIAFEPGNLGGRILETDTGGWVRSCRHCVD